MSLSEPSKEELIERNIELRDENDALRDENQVLKERLDERAEIVAALKAELRQYKNAHTPSSKQRGRESSGGGSDEAGEGRQTEDDDAPCDTDHSSGRETEDEEARSNGDTTSRGRNPGHEGAHREWPEVDEVVTVSRQFCPCCGDLLDEPVDITYRVIEEIPEPQRPTTTQYSLHTYHCSGCDSTVETSHPDCPPEGQFGVNVIAHVAYARFVCRLPYRKIVQQLDDLFGFTISAAAGVWNCLRRIARWGREEYAAIREQIREADAVYVDETGMSLDGEQGWIWTFTSADATLYTVDFSRGSEVVERVLTPEFSGTMINDGWTAYPAFTDSFQRCWAHILREAEFVAEAHPEAEEIADRLYDLYDELKTFLAEDPSDLRCEEKQREARAILEDIAGTACESEEVQRLLTKIGGGLGHWLVFVIDPNVKATNNTAENALREPVVLRKIIGTIRNE